MENNQQNQASFFAQYWGVNCLENDDFVWRSNENFDTVLSIYNGDLSSWYAKLTPLSQISDEDAIEVAKQLYRGNNLITILQRDNDGRFLMDIDSSSSLDESYKIQLHFNQIHDHYYGSGITSNGITHFNLISAFDYLRSKGYSLPFNGLSEEDLISYGWVKLKQIENGK